jgi:sirohydrochlorin cobaltochelatase
MSTGLVLFAHGARDPRWREPFDRLRAKVTASHPGPVELAFLELTSPDLGQACATLVRAGALRIVVVPLFLGTGGHLRNDLPGLLAAAQAQVGVPVNSVTAAGEDDQVLSAIAEYSLRAAQLQPQTWTVNR